MAFQAAIFDLDGTLIDSLSDIAWSANHVLVQQGFAVHEKREYLRFVGQGLQQLFRQALPPDQTTEENVQCCCAAFRDIYREHWNVDTRPYDGIAALLDRLQRIGVALAVLSNKPHEFTVRCADVFFRDVAFSAVLGQREGVPRKPDPTAALEIAAGWSLPPEACLYVGDTATDIETALAAGMHPVGVLWGFRPKQELVDAGARGLVSEPAELLRFFDSRGADGL
jgi:phosphoglycolate phosphatase